MKEHRWAQQCLLRCGIASPSHSAWPQRLLSTFPLRELIHDWKHFRKATVEAEEVTHRCNMQWQRTPMQSLFHVPGFWIQL